MRLMLAALFLSICAQLAAAQDWEAVESPTAIVILRHALAPGGGDPAGFVLGECSTQRNLDARGRAQAARIGAELRARGIDFDAVWTSQWCRSAETAELLGLGAVQDVPALNSFFSNRARGPRQTRALLELLRDHAGGRLMLVTHQVNITALTEVFPRSGEMVVFEMKNGTPLVTGRILVDP